jgi:hypothetical protein
MNMSSSKQQTGTTYLVWCPSRGATKEDGRRIVAYCPGYAVERWAEWDDASSADYTIVSGTPVEVLVAEEVPGAQEQRFIVSGESVPQYRASEAKG